MSLIRRGQQNLVLFVLCMDYARVLVGRASVYSERSFIWIITEYCEGVKGETAFKEIESFYEKRRVVGICGSVNNFRIGWKRGVFI